MRKDFEYFLASCHWLDVTDGPLEGHLAGLTKTMRHLLLERAEEEADQRHAEAPGRSEPAVPASAASVAADGEAAPATAIAPRRRRRGVLGWALFILIAGAGFYAVWHKSPDHPNALHTPPPDPSASPPSSSGAIDLLARFRIPQDVVSGEWTRTDGGIHVAGPAPGRANFGEPPAGDYDLRVEFTPLIGEQGVGVILSRFGQNFAFGLSSDAGHLFGFGLERGKPARRQTLAGTGHLQNNTRYAVVVQVRRHGAVAMINGQRVAELFTADFRELSPARQWAVGKNSLGLVTYRTVLIHSAECVPVKEEPDERAAR
jgi:hypothetical protein